MLEVIGSPGSSYTRKFLALLRYRQIPYTAHWTNGEMPKDYPKPKVRLLPMVYAQNPKGEREVLTDTSPIIRAFEDEYLDRSTIPTDPVLGMLNSLIEDYADEWLTKAMFHYRWADPEKTDYVASLLTFWRYPALDQADADEASVDFAARQIGRLSVVGSNDTTGPLIESAFERLVDILDQLLGYEGFVFGKQPSSADFAIYGQMTQVGLVGLGSSKILREKSLRVRAWLDVMEDVSGHAFSVGGWTSRDEARRRLGPLLKEIGRTYVPVMIANARAAMSGAKQFETTVDGHQWVQPVFPYQAKCLAWLREEHDRLSDADRASYNHLVEDTGCEHLCRETGS